MATLLAKLGAAALKPQLVDGVWHKAAISAKNAARLRRETLLSGQCVPPSRSTKTCPPTQTHTAVYLAHGFCSRRTAHRIGRPHCGLQPQQIEIDPALEPLPGTG